ncbi:MAG: Crp/Fnr family transcriptional regulator [Flavobacteriales bacterium]
MSFNIANFHFRSNILLKNVHANYIKQLNAISKIEKLKKGAVLYQEKTNPRGVYFVKRGKVKIEQCNEEGATRILYVYSAGEFFGFRPLLCNELHPVSAIVLENSEVEIYEGNEFIKIARRSPYLSFNLVEILSFEFTVWTNFITSLTHKSAKERVALILLILNEKYKTDDRPGNITMSKMDIAAYSDTSEETVVRVISFFQEQGIVKNYGRKFSIVNKEMLEVIAEGF